MISENRVYCLKCDQVVHIEKAGQIFRTGYYKCSMRLGLCKTCTDLGLEAKPAYLNDTEDPYLATELL
jgi:hypothetical protein